MDNLKELLQRQIEVALTEDVGPGDITSLACLDERPLAAVVVAKSSGILAGLPLVEILMRKLDSDIEIRPYKNDTDPYETGDDIIYLKGNSSAILTGERTALNFLGHLSGVAGLTRRFVEKVRLTGAVILDTRKTIPGLRYLEKYAVVCGGGQNHRHGLYDMVLIKDNHIAAAGSISEAVGRVKTFLHSDRFKDKFAGKPDEIDIEVEVETPEQLEEAIAAGVVRLLLDNQSLDQLATLVRKARALSDGLKLEASGNVNLDNVAAVAATGVDYISIGALTHSAPAADFSLMVVDIDASR